MRANGLRRFAGIDKGEQVVRLSSLRKKPTASNDADTFVLVQSRESEPGSPTPGDPYAPPGASGSSSTFGHAPGRYLSWMFGLLIPESLFLKFAPLISISVGQSASLLLSGIMVARVVLWTSWLYAAWKGIPEKHRGTITPRRAALSSLIPVYGTYWDFAFNVALCDTLNGILERGSSSRRAPRILGIVANAAGWVSFVLRVTTRLPGQPRSTAVDVVPLLVDALWFAYMVLCDHARESVARLGERAVLGAPRLSAIQRTRGPGAIAAVGFIALALLGLACWQILSPNNPRAASHQAP